MAVDAASGYVAASSLQDLTDDSLPMFNVVRVQLQFSIAADLVAAQVANNALILALSTGRILRIDLGHPEDIEDVDLPKKPSEIGVIRRMFLDPTASHLIINTTLGDNYYLHTQSRTPKVLSRLKGVPIECIAWNPSLPTASTREILIGSSDGTIYETFLELSTEFYRREEKYVKPVYKISKGPIVGLWTDVLPGSSDMRRVLVATRLQLLHFVGRIGRTGSEGSSPVFTRLFETESPTVREGADRSSSSPAMFAVSPDPPEVHALENASAQRIYGWLSAQGVLTGTLLTSPSTAQLGSRVFSESRLMPRSVLPPSLSASGRKKPSEEPVISMLLTQWHLVQIVDGRLVAINRLDNTVVYDQVVLEPGQSVLALVTDQKMTTFWLFTSQEIFEIVVNDEDRNIWKIMLADQQFDAALQYTKTSAQRDAVAKASGDYLVTKSQFLDAAGVYGKSTKPFEQVALTFIDQGDQDALRKYLLTKLSTLKKSSTMQRVMLASWLVELYMSKLNSLDDTITTKAELSESMTTADSKDQLSAIRKEFQNFVSKHRSDLDQKTTYEVVSSHGREEELLYYANAINDYSYVLAYWVQREKWSQALSVLKKQTDPEIYYKYSSVLMAHAPTDFVDILMRQSNLDARRLVPALLNYNTITNVPLSQNQAVRYLLFEINQHQSSDAAIHNTLLSIYASAPSRDESALLSYLESQSPSSYSSSSHTSRDYDADFALRLGIQHSRIQSCIHIYSSMGKYASAVDLALDHDEVDLAATVADRPENDPALRKKLWLKVAKKVIQQSASIKAAIDFLKRCDLLRIEDLIPFFPDFVVIDDFKSEICEALEEYSRHIDALKKEMDDSAATAAHIKSDIKTLEQRYAIVEPGEKCWVCGWPLLTRAFFVFSCQHAFHGDCLGKRVVEMSGVGRGTRIRELQAAIGRATSAGGEKERMVRELDGLVASSCVLCGDLAVKMIDEPFVTDADDKNEWAL